jgi:rhodanese-related sulfurtransferase
MSGMRSIDTDELRRLLAGGADVRLVACLDLTAFTAAHIPGSLHFTTPEDAAAILDADDEVVLYGAGGDGSACAAFHVRLTERGFRRVRVYHAGLAAWQRAGLPLDGTE